MSEPLFAPSRIKIERARGFIKELEQVRLDYLARNPCRGKFAPGTTHPPTQVLVQWDSPGLLPGAILGDAVHNLRTALDLMASELATLNRRSNKDVYFPIADSEANLDIQIDRKCFNKAGPDAVELLRSLKPYRGGNDPLRTLHDLDISDKHTALILTQSNSQIEVFGQYNMDDASKDDVRVQVLSVEFAFPDDSPFPGASIVETLEQLVELVEGILEAFTRLVEIRGTGEAKHPTA